MRGIRKRKGEGAFVFCFEKERNNKSSNYLMWECEKQRKKAKERKEGIYFSWN